MRKSKKFIIAFIAIFFLCAFSVTADSPYRYIRDDAGVLSDDSAAAIESKLEDFRANHEFDLVIVTSTGVASYERQDYADDYYDYNGYGYGEDHDGALLLVNVFEDGSYESGNSWISTCGSGLSFITDEDISDIGEELTPLLIGGDYAKAFDIFPDLVGDDIAGKKFKGILIVIGSALVLGIICAVIYTGKLKNEMNSVAAAAEANNYVVDGSLKLDRSYDHFLYSSITKTEKQSSSSSSHTSSSGATHGGGGF